MHHQRKSFFGILAVLLVSLLAFGLVSQASAAKPDFVDLTQRASTVPDSGTVKLPTEAELQAAGGEILADYDWYVATNGDDTNDGSQASPFKTIQKAINSSTAGQKIFVSNGIYNEKLVITHGLTITGQNKTSVEINTNSLMDYGIDANGNFTTYFSNFTLYGPGNGIGYGFKIAGDAAETTIENVVVKDYHRSGIDLNGLNKATLKDITVLNNGGVGLALTNTSNVTVENITTNGNEWGGIAVYTDSTVFTQGADNISITGTNSYAETPGFYTEIDPAHPVTNLNVPDFAYTVENQTDKANYTFFMPNLETAKAMALGTTTPKKSVIRQIASGDWYVEPGMSIKAAVEAAESGDTINVAAGTYNEDYQIVVDKNLTIIGAGAATTIVKPTQNTGSSADARGWWLVPAGHTFNLSKLTLDGEGFNISNAIRSYSETTITDSVFKNISHPGYAGIAVVVYDANGTIKNNSFSGIGRIGVAVYGAQMTAGVIENNTFTGKGVGDWVEYGVQLEAGATATVQKNTFSNYKGIASSDGSNSAGILASSYFAPNGTNATITGNTITDSTNGVFLGFNNEDNTNASVSGNTISVDNAYIYASNPQSTSITIGENTLGNVVRLEGNPYALFTTIQAAVDAAEAGDTVLVGAGTYAEQVVIDKALTLQGPNADKLGFAADRVEEAIITFPANLSSDQDLVNISAAGVVFNGFTLDGKALPAEHLSEGVYSEASNVTISHNIVKNFTKIGIRSGAAYGGPFHENVVVKNNKVFSDEAAYAYTYSGVYLQGTQGTVDSNVITNANRGLQIQPYTSQSVTKGVVSNNTISAYRTGIYYNYSENTTQVWNFTDNVLNAIPAPSGVTPEAWEGILTQTYNGGTPNFTGNTVNPAGATSPNVYYYREINVTGEPVDLDALIEHNTLGSGMVRLRNAEQVILRDLFASIQIALNNAQDGQAVMVYPGTYLENVDSGNRILKNISVIGVPATDDSLPVIRGSLKLGAPRTVGGDYAQKNTAVENLRIEADINVTNLLDTTRHALWVENFEGAQLRNLQLIGTGEEMFEIQYGLSLGGRSKDYTLENVTIENFLLGVYGRALNMQVVESQISHIEAGINIMGGGNLSIVDSQIVTEVKTGAKDLYAVRFGEGNVTGTPGVLDFSVSRSTLSLNNPDNIVPDEGKYMRSIVLRGNAGGIMNVTQSNIPQGILNIASVPVEASANYWGHAETPVEEIDHVGLVNFCGWLDAPAPGGTLTGNMVKNTNTGTLYCSLGEAVAGATAGDTLQLLGDVVEPQPLEITKSLTIDTNGKTLSNIIANQGDKFIRVKNSAEVTITGSGLIKTSGAEDPNDANAEKKGYAVRVEGGAKVTLDGATLYGGYFAVEVVGDNTADQISEFTMNSGTVNRGVFVRQKGATVTINDGTINNAGGLFAPIQGHGSAGQGGTTITINGGTLNWEGGIGIYHPQDGVLNIHGGVINGHDGIEMKAGTLNMTGGTVNANGPLEDDPPSTGSSSTETGDAIYVAVIDAYTGEIHINITGGTLNSTNNYSVRVKRFGDENKLKSLVVHNTNVNNKISNSTSVMLDASANWWGTADGPEGQYTGLVKYCGHYDAPIPDGNLVYGSRVKNETTSALYCSIQEAVDTATAGDTLTLEAGTFAEQVVINKALTLQGPNADKYGFAEDRVEEAVITYPEDIVWEHSDELANLVKVAADGVTIKGIKMVETPLARSHHSSLIFTWSANDLVVQNNVLLGTTIPVYRSAADPVKLDNSGWLIEGNLIDGLTNVNSRYGRGVYIWKTRADVVNNRIVNTNVGVQILPNGLNGGGTVKENVIMAGSQGLYHNNADKGAGDWSFVGNTISMAPNTREAQDVYGPYNDTHSKVLFRLIDIINLGGSGTGVTPKVSFLQNNFDGSTVANSENHVEKSVGIYLRGTVAADASITIHENAFVNIEAENGLLRDGTNAVANVDASGNWWGSNDYATVKGLFSDPLINSIDITPWLDSGEDADTVKAGFQATKSHYHVVEEGLQLGEKTRIQETIDMISGSTVTVHAGTYAGGFTVNKALNLEGPNKGIDPVNGTRVAEAVLQGDAVMTVDAANVVVDGFKFDKTQLNALQATAVKNNIFTKPTDKSHAIALGLEADGGVDPLNAAYTFEQNQFTDTTPEYLKVFLPTAATEAQTTAMNAIFKAVSDPAAVAMYVPDTINPYAYIAGLRPVGVADEYAVEWNQTLDVLAADGVLKNDTDPNGLPLTATKVSDPQTGTLIFRADGSFSYVHPGGEYFTPVTFTYTVSNGVVTSEPITVTLNVTYSVGFKDGGAIYIAMNRTDGKHLLGVSGDFTVEGMFVKDAQSLEMKLYAGEVDNPQLLQTNTIKSMDVFGPTADNFTSSFDIFGAYTSSSWENVKETEYGQTVPATHVIATVTMPNGYTFSRTAMINNSRDIIIRGDIAPQDFGYAAFSGVRGVSAGFEITDMGNLRGAQSLVVKLYGNNTAGDEVLLQTNTAILASGQFEDFLEFSTPFDIYGNFDYAADGYWTNVRQREYGRNIDPTCVEATVEFLNGTTKTARNCNPTGDNRVIPSGSASYYVHPTRDYLGVSVDVRFKNFVAADAESIKIELFGDQEGTSVLLQTNEAILTLPAFQGDVRSLTSPFNIFGQYLPSSWTNTRNDEFGQTVPVSHVLATVTFADGTVLTRVLPIRLERSLIIRGDIQAEDFGYVAQNDVYGVTAGFGIIDRGSLYRAQSIVVKLYAGENGDQLLQTNTAILEGDKFKDFTNFSTPFDIFGDFDYVADGYWTNVREDEYGQNVVPTCAEATVEFFNGTTKTARNCNLTGDREIILRGELTVMDFYYAYNAPMKGVSADMKLTDATSDDAVSIVVELFTGEEGAYQLLQTNTANLEKFNAASIFTSPFDIYGTRNYVGSSWANVRETEYGQDVIPTRVLATVTLKNGKVLTAERLILTGDRDQIVPSVVAEDFTYGAWSGIKGVNAGFHTVNFDLGQAVDVKVELFSGADGDVLMQTDTWIKENDAWAGMQQYSAPFDIFGTFDYVADGYWTNARETEYGQTAIPRRVLTTITLPGDVVVTAENTNLTGDRRWIVSTLDEEIRTAKEYTYTPPYVYVGDITFDDAENLYHGTYTPKQFFDKRATFDLARYLGALHRQAISTVQKITFEGVEYTWQEVEPILKGSNWRKNDDSTITLVRVVSDMVIAGEIEENEIFSMVLSDGHNTETVRFKFTVTNTLDAEIGSGFDYEYSDEYEYVGAREFDDPNNIYTVTYPETQVNPHAMYDLARYLGALYRQDGATVSSIEYKGVKYTWNAEGTLLGSNWEDDEGNTLVSVITADFLSGAIDPAVGIVLTVSDGIHTETVTFKMVINNVAPVAVDDAYATDEDVTLTVAAADGVLKNDTDVSPLTAELVEGPAHGWVELAENGSFKYMPEANWHGEDSFTYKAFDGEWYSNIATVTITVKPVQDAPVAEDQAVTTPEDTPIVITLLATDADGDALTYEIVAGPTNGTATLVGNVVTYTPNANWHGVDSFTFKANDGTTDSNIATVTITVTDVKDDVVANDDAYSVIQGKVLTVAAPGVLENDEDIDENVMTATLKTPAANGTVILKSDGSFVYTPNPDFSGTDTFEYTLVTSPMINGTGLWRADATVTITVYGKPVISSDDIEGPYHVGKQQLYHVSLSNPANGMEYNPVSVEIVAEGIKFTDFEKIELQHPDGSDNWFDLVAMGLIVEEGNNLVMRTPVIDGMPIEPGFDYTLTFRVTFKTAGQYPVTGTLYYYPDSNGNDYGAPFEVAKFTSTMVVLEANPVAVNDAYETFIGETLSVAAPGVLANDTFAGPEALVAERVTSVSNGTLEFNPDGSFTYVPNAGYYGTDSFTYKVTAAGQVSNVATVEINVYTKPTISSDNIEGPYYVGYEQEYHMKLANPAGGKTYNPVQIEIFAENVVLDDIETIKVEHPAQAGEWIDLKPLVVADAGGLRLVTPIVPLPIEPDNDYTLTFLVEFKKEGTYPVTGTLYHYPASDGSDHGDAVAVADFSSEMVVLKDIPVAVDDAYETDEDVTLTVSAANGVLKNDTLNALGTLTAVLVETVDAAHGTLTFAPDGSFEFVPVANWHGTTTFTYKATDGKHESAPATVTIVVKDVKDPVQAVDDEYETNEDTVLTVAAPGVLDNDIDVDNNIQKAYVLTQPENGAVTMTQDGGFVYTPKADFNGTDTFTYELATFPRTNSEWTDSATVTITVKPVNDAPVLDDLTGAEIPVNVAYTFTASGSDVDGDTLTFSLKNAPAGAAIDESTGDFSWTPGWDDLGANTFQVCVSDGELEVCKDITLTVTNVNTLDEEIGTIKDYAYTPPYAYVGDISFDDTTNTYHGIYTPAQFLDKRATFDLARLLGALHRQDGSTVQSITFNEKVYTWKFDPPDHPELKGSNWRDENMKTLVSQVSDMVIAGDIVEEQAITMVVTDGHNTETIIFKFTVTNTLDAEIGSGFDYEYDPAYNYVGAREFDDSNNIYTVTYDETQVAPHAMNDLARYLGALYRQDGATVRSIEYKGVTYTWDAEGTLVGSNWKDADGKTLVSVITADFLSGTINPDVGIVLTVADGIHTETVTFKMIITNVAPELAPIEGATIPELVEYTFTATASDVPTATLTFSLVGAPEGAMIDGSTGVFTWTPTEAQGPGTFSFTVKVCDNGTPVLCDQKTFEVDVKEVNIPPVLAEIGDKTVVATEELTFTATATDEDIPVQTLTFSLKDAPVGAEIDATTGVFTWTPTAAQVGDHTFKVCVSDGVAEVCEEITVTVEESVVVNLPPVAVADAYETNEDVALIIAAPGVLENDSDPNGDAITAILVSEPEHGTLALAANGGFVYSPNADWNGTDTFTYKASDGTLESEDATVTITVNPVNDAPVAVDDAYTVAEDTLLSIAAPGVLANDYDVDGDVLNATVRTNPSHGTLSFTSDGSFTYMPDPDWHGTDSFTYNLITHPAPTSGWTDWATVTITVTPVNDAPVLDPIADATIPEMVAYTFTATATDVDSTNLTFSLVNAPAGATINASTGVFTWTPTEAQGPNVFTFTVKVCDDATPALCDQQDVTLSVLEVNRAPEIEDIEDQEVTVGEELTFTAVASDPDLPANTLTFRLEEAPAGAAIDPTTGKFTWTPVESQIGEHEFYVCVTDGQLNTSTLVKVTVKQGHVNTPPVAVADTYAVDQDQVLTIAAPGVLANDTDADNDTLTAILVSTTSNGTLTFKADGSFVYTPNAGFEGLDTFTYKANDGKADSNVVTVTITVRKVEPVMPYQMYYPVIFQGW